MISSSKEMDKSENMINLDEKIFILLERLNRVTRLLLWDVAKTEGLSPIQIQILLFLLEQPEERCRVSGLADEFSLTQATISDAVRVLQDKNYVKKQILEKDHRVSTLMLTSSGQNIGQRISNWNRIFIKQIEDFSEEVKRNVFHFLIDLVIRLKQIGIIDVVRMCINCKHFKKDVFPGQSKPHYCALTDTAISDFEYRIDCRSYSPNDFKTK